MVVVHEFRIPLPLSAAEFHRGQLHMTAALSSEECNGQEGIEWVANEPYDNTDGRAPPSAHTGVAVPHDRGQYTLKRLLLRSKVPGIVAHLVPRDSLFLIEEAWNAYPRCKTVLVNGYLDAARFRIVVDTLHVDADTELANAHSLPPAELALREVEYVDVRAAAGTPGRDGYAPQQDVTRFTSSKTGRGPLTAEHWWRQPRGDGVPLMCAYKLVRAQFAYWGLQAAVERLVLSSQRELFARSHARAYCTLDEWVDLSMEDVRALEDQTAKKAAATLSKAPGGSATASSGSLVHDGATAALT